MHEKVQIPLTKLIEYKEEYDKKLMQVKESGTPEEVIYWEGFCAGLHIAAACFAEVLYDD